MIDRFYYRQTTHDGILKAMNESNEENVEHIWKNNIQTQIEWKNA